MTAIGTMRTTTDWSGPPCSWDRVSLRASLSPCPWTPRPVLFTEDMDEWLNQASWAGWRSSRGSFPEEEKL